MHAGYDVRTTGAEARLIHLLQYAALHWISAVSSCVELSVSWVFCCVIGWDVSWLGRWPWGLRRGRRAGS